MVRNNLHEHCFLPGFHDLGPVTSTLSNVSYGDSVRLCYQCERLGGDNFYAWLAHLFDYIRANYYRILLQSNTGDGRKGKRRRVQEPLRSWLESQLGIFFRTIQDVDASLLPISPGRWPVRPGAVRTTRIQLLLRVKTRY